MGGTHNSDRLSEALKIQTPQTFNEIMGHFLIAVPRKIKKSYYIGWTEIMVIREARVLFS